MSAAVQVLMQRLGHAGLLTDFHPLEVQALISELAADTGSLTLPAVRNFMPRPQGLAMVGFTRARV